MTVSLQKVLFLLCCLPALASTVARGEPLEPVHLNEAVVIERVREQNLLLLFEREGVRRALESMYQERASLLPSLSLNAVQTRNRLTRSFSGAALDPVYVNQFDASLVGTQTLFDVERFAAYRVAQLEYAVARLDYETVEQDVLAQALGLYYTQLRDRSAVRLSEGTIRRNQDLYELAVNQFDAGAATRIDVTRAEVELARSRRQLLQSRTNVADSALRLKTLLDIGADRPIELDRTPLGGVRPDPDLKQSGEKRGEAAYRPELLAQRERLNQAEEVRRAARLQRLPTLELFGEWGYQTEEAFDGNEEEAWLVGVRMSMPIFEGFRIGAEMREAAAAVRQNEFRLRDLENEVRREFEFALVNLESRYEQIAIAGDEERLARDELDLALERYRGGVADNRELIDAQQRLAVAEDEYLQAVFLYHLSRVDFARSVGSVEEAPEVAP